MTQKIHPKETDGGVIHKGFWSLKQGTI